MGFSLWICTKCMEPGRGHRSTSEWLSQRKRKHVFVSLFGRCGYAFVRCRRTAEELPKHHRRTTQELPKNCRRTDQELPKNCPRTAQPRSAQELPKNCRRAAEEPARTRQDPPSHHEAIQEHRFQNILWPFSSLRSFSSFSAIKGYPWTTRHSLSLPVDTKRESLVLASARQR